MTTSDLMSPREIAEEFVREQMESERAELQVALDSALRLEKELEKAFKKADNAWWKLASRDLDAEPDQKEKEAEHNRDVIYARLSSTGRAVSANREKLARLDLSFDRRVSDKMREVERRTNGNGNHNKGENVSATASKRVPVPQATVDRVVELVKTKSQQEVANLLNKEGKTTASGKPWTPQNIWHLVKKATGKGVPRKASQNGGRKTTAKPKAKKAAKPKATAKKSSAKPLSKASQAAGTSRGGSGSRKRTGGGRKINNRRK